MISVLLPTAGRPGMAEAAVRSLIATTEGHDIELVLAADGDHETVERVLSLDAHDGFHVRVDHHEERRGSSRAWNDALRLATGDPMVLAADDLEFASGWLEAALATLQEFSDGWGLVGFNDGHWGADLSTHYMMSRRLIVEVFGGVVAWDCYRHSFNDREANARAIAASRYAWCEDAHVLHRHWIFGDRSQDSTDTRLLGEHSESQRRFDERQAAGFPNDFDPVIGGIHGEVQERKS